MKEVVFLAAGEADLLAHYDRLDAAQPGTGESFSDALDDGLALISRHPFLARAHRGSIRRFILRRFHLGVFYTVEGRRILVCRRNLVKHAAALGLQLQTIPSVVALNLRE